MPRSFGVLPKSTVNSIHTINSTKESLTLPEASYFSSRRVAQDFDRIVDTHNAIDDCFGFDLDDDDEDVPSEPTDKRSENTNESAITLSKTTSKKEPLKEIREKLKRFLQNPEAEPNESVKKTKVIRFETAIDKSKAKKVKTPMKSPAKVVNSPAKPKRNIVFGDTAAKQKDIRSAFTAKSGDKHAKKDNADPVLFGEIETVCDIIRDTSLQIV